MTATIERMVKTVQIRVPKALAFEAAMVAGALEIRVNDYIADRLRKAVDADFHEVAKKAAERKAATKSPKPKD